MALRLHMDKNIGDAFITFYVAFIRKLRCVYGKKKWRCVYRTGRKNATCLPGNSHCSRRTLQAWPGRYGAFFLLLFPLLGKGKMVVVPMFDRVHKD